MKILFLLFLTLGCFTSAYASKTQEKKILKVTTNTKSMKKSNCENQDLYMMDIVHGYCNAACDKTLSISKLNKCQMPFAGLVSDVNIAEVKEDAGKESVNWVGFCKSCCHLFNSGDKEEDGVCEYTCNEQVAALDCYKELINYKMREQLENLDAFKAVKETEEC